MKKMMIALLCYVGLSACNGGGSSEPVIVDSLTGNDTSMQMPADTVYPQSDTSSINRDTNSKTDTAAKK